jgi:hypothetical protein
MSEVNPSRDAGIVVPGNQSTEKGDSREFLEIDHPRHLQQPWSTAKVIYDMVNDDPIAAAQAGGLVWTIGKDPT